MITTSASSELGWIETQIKRMKEIVKQSEKLKFGSALYEDQLDDFITAGKNLEFKLEQVLKDKLLVDWKTKNKDEGDR